ncbi:NfeD family protein [Klebsiella pneumoniae]
MHNGRGRAEIEGTTWPVAGPDLPAGTRVEVFGRDGADLLVRAVAEGR